jgi:Cu/Ag efflux pump CusA
MQLNAFKTEIDDCFRCHYCIITFSDWNRYELHQPLAIAVIGVLIAMPLLLIVLPSLLYYFNIEQKSS